MPRLYQVFSRLNNAACSYEALPDGIERLIIGSPGGEESVKVIATEHVTAITYEGKPASMTQTIAALRLPRAWPENIWAQAFYLFSGILSQYSGEDRSKLLVEFTPGREGQSEYVLVRLLEVYARMSYEGSKAAARMPALSAAS